MNSPASSAIKQAACTRFTCRKTCALEVVDGLLRDAGSVRGEEVDGLLDFRWVLRHREDAEATLALFCQLRRAMEERHYLAFYRVRRWLENQIEVFVRLHPKGQELRAPLKLDFYCVEAIRHHSLRNAGPQVGHVAVPRVRFAFRPSGVVETDSLPVCPEEA
jgi:hypothetical protein